MGEHLIGGEFQSDKYPTTPRGKVPLSCKDPMAQDLLWEYAQRRRAVDAKFSGDLERALNIAGFSLGSTRQPMLWCCHVRGPDDVHAAPDYETALKWADQLNALNWRDGGAVVPVASPEDRLIRAIPAPWPWSAELHAEDLPRAIADFTAKAKASR